MENKVKILVKNGVIVDIYSNVEELDISILDDEALMDEGMDSKDRKEFIENEIKGLKEIY